MSDAPAYAVYRHVSTGWLPISRSWPTREQAHAHLEQLPTDWETEVREVSNETA